MITLYGFGRVHRAVIGETRDLRVEWALLEMDLPYKVHGVDHTAGEMKTEEFGEINCLKLLPVIEDEGFRVSESGAILLYLAEKSGKLIPSDFQGRTRVTQWCFSALTTVERPIFEIQILDKFGGDSVGERTRRAEMVKQSERWFKTLETLFESRPWVAGEEFTVADILLASVFREIRMTDLLEAYPRLTDYYERCHARPAWKRTLEVYAQRLGVDPAEIA